MAGETEANRSELLQRPHRDNSRIGTDAWFGWSFYQDDLPILDHTFGWFPMFGQWKTDLSAAPVIAIAPAHDGGPDGGAHMGVRLEDLAEGQSRAWDKANQFGTPCRLFFL
jgi:hypothetical protein